MNELRLWVVADWRRHQPFFEIVQGQDFEIQIWLGSPEAKYSEPLNPLFGLFVFIMGNVTKTTYKNVERNEVNKRE